MAEASLRVALPSADRAWARQAPAPRAVQSAADHLGIKPIKRALLSLILFGIAFGYLEAAVVVYLRALSGPMRVSAGLSASDLFPLLNFRQVAPDLYLIKIEILREAATLLMLATVAAAMAKNLRTWLAAFAIAFGVWDLSFYASLKALIGWPESLLTWDLLFLLPVPWTGPVLSPVIVATSLTIGGILAMLREPPRVGWVSLSMLLLGAAIILAAFTWDWRYIYYGGVPRHFPWLLFTTGEILGICGASFSLQRRLQATSSPVT